MKNKYSAKQIKEAIQYWKSQLNEECNEDASKKTVELKEDIPANRQQNASFMNYLWVEAFKDKFVIEDVKGRVICRHKDAGKVIDKHEVNAKFDVLIGQANGFYAVQFPTTKIDALQDAMLFDSFDDCKKFLKKFYGQQSAMNTQETVLLPNDEDEQSPFEVDINKGPTNVDWYEDKIGSMYDTYKDNFDAFSQYGK